MIEFVSALLLIHIMSSPPHYWPLMWRRRRLLALVKKEKKSSPEIRNMLFAVFVRVLFVLLIDRATTGSRDKWFVFFSSFERKKNVLNGLLNYLDDVQSSEEPRDICFGALMKISTSPVPCRTLWCLFLETRGVDTASRARDIIGILLLIKQHYWMNRIDNNIEWSQSGFTFNFIFLFHPIQL